MAQHTNLNASKIYVANLFFIFMAVGVELRASQLLGRHSLSRAMLSALFALVILEIGSCFWPSLDRSPPVLGFPSLWNDSHEPLCPAFGRD
jgi:hypothetical protein